MYVQKDKYIIVGTCIIPVPLQENELQISKARYGILFYCLAVNGVLCEHTNGFWCIADNVVNLECSVCCNHSSNTVKPVYNDHLMGYLSAFWS